MRMSAHLFGNKSGNDIGRMRKTLPRSSMHASEAEGVFFDRAAGIFGAWAYSSTRVTISPPPRPPTNKRCIVRSRAFFPPPPLPTCNDKDDVISSMISNSIDCSYRDENDMEEIISLPLTVHSSSSSSGGRNVHFQVVLCVDTWQIFDCLSPSLHYELRSDTGIVSPSSHSAVPLSNARTTRGG